MGGHTQGREVEDELTRLAVVEAVVKHGQQVAVSRKEGVGVVVMQVGRVLR